jgi:hypothetical protein
MNWRGFGTGHGLLKVLSWHLPGGTEDSHRKIIKAMTWLKFSVGTTQLEFNKKDLLEGPDA